MNKKTLLIALAATTVMTGCSNMHEFLNSDFLNTVSPTAATALKVGLYPDRYKILKPGDKVIPNDISNLAKDNIGEYKFVAFLHDDKNYEQILAEYYIPVKANGAPTVDVNLAYFTRFPSKTGSGKTYQSIKMLFTFNCQKSTYTPKSATTYTGRYLDGDVVTNKTLSGKDIKSYPIEVGSFEQTIQQKVCN